MANEIAKRASNLPVIAHDYGEDAGAGYQNQTADDFQIPFLSLLQKGSPQVDEEDGLEGAKPGMIIDTGTDELFDEVEFVPALTEHAFIEWIPRDIGGGFVARHERTSEVVVTAKAESTEFGKYSMPNGNDLVETFYVYGVIVSEGVMRPVIIAFSSKKIGIYKKWNSKNKSCMIQNEDGSKSEPPMFAHLTKITSAGEQNVHGKFFNFRLAPANGKVADSLLAPDDERLLKAKELMELVTAGKVEVNYDKGADSDAPEQHTAF